MPREAKIWASDNFEKAVLTRMSESDECLYETVLIADIEYCAAPWAEMQAEFVCLTAEDQGMVQAYIATLVNKCRRWRE